VTLSTSLKREGSFTHKIDLKRLYLVPDSESLLQGGAHHHSYGMATSACSAHGWSGWGVLPELYLLPSVPAGLRCWGGVTGGWEWGSAQFQDPDFGDLMDTL